MTDGQALPHTLTLADRQKLTMTGVSEVVSFDEAFVVLKTSLGTLAVQGTGLQLKQLTPEGGNVTVEGEISSLQYTQSRHRGGWAGRLFG